MKAHHPSASQARAEKPAYVHLSGRWPLLIKVLWVVMAALLLYLFVTTLPIVTEQMRTPCQPETCQWLQYTTAQIESLSAVGLSPNTFIALTVALGLTAMVVSWVVSAAIIWRRSTDWMAVLVAFFLLVLGTVLTSASVPYGPTPWLNPNAYVLSIISTLLPAVFCLFPSGRFAPRWTRWILVVALIVQTPLGFIPNSVLQANTSAGQLGWLVFVAVMLALTAGQIYRYRSESTSIERQQTKWALVGFAVPVVVIAILITVTFLLASLGTPTSPIILLYPLVGFLLPIGLSIGFGFAIQRSRLWEIDTLINRAMVYGTLTLILSLSYVGFVIGLQTLLRGVIGQGNSAALVISTLVIATLALPLRRRLQTFIDRRFYRHKYDAAKTLQAFSDTLRHELRTETLREQLLDVVHETMQPTHASLWLCPLPKEHQTSATREASYE